MIRVRLRNASSGWLFHFVTSSLLGKTLSLSDFLARAVAEADILSLNEVHAFVALPNILREVAEDRFKSIRESSRPSDGGVTCWPEPVKYIIRSYVTVKAIHEATLALRDTEQRLKKAETDY